MSSKKRTPEQKAADRCAVARDLMVLCVDGLASEASQRRVKRHVKDCPPCKLVWQDMRTPAVPEPPTPVEDPQFDQAVRKVRSKQKWRSLRKVLLGVLLAVLVALAGLAAWGYWGEQVEVSLYEHFYDMQARYTTDGEMYIRVSAVPQSAVLQVRINPETGSLIAWMTTSRATDWQNASLADRDYYIGQVEKMTQDEGGLPLRKVAVTDRRGITYRFWLNETYQGAVPYSGLGFVEEETDISALTQLGRVNIVIRQDDRKPMMTVPPTSTICCEEGTQEPYDMERESWGEPFVTPTPMEEVQSFPMCTAEPSAQID